MKKNVLEPPIPQGSQQQLRWSGLSGSSTSLALSRLAEKQHAPILLITPDQHMAYERLCELQFFTKLPILSFPDWETLPYDHFSPHEDLTSERLATLFRVTQLQQGIIVAAIPTLMHRLAPRAYLQSHSFLLKLGDKLDLKKLREQLVATGYHHNEQVMMHGEFAIRGSIVDLFPMGAQHPFRIELFDNEVESIRLFDTETQRSQNKTESIFILPAYEFPLTEEGITLFRTNWRAKYPGNPLNAPIYQSISRGEAPQGIEYYLPLFFEQMETFFDYLPKTTLIVLANGANEQATLFWQEINERFEQCRYDTSRPLLDPAEGFLPVNELFGKLKPFAQIKLTHDKANVIFDTEMPIELPVNHRDKAPLQSVDTFLKHFEGRILFCAESTGRRETLLDLLKEINIKPTLYDNWHAFLNDNTGIGITVAPLNQGLILHHPKLALITESQLFGKQVMQRRLRKHRELDPNLLIRNLTELNIGAPVVHIEHGVGRYRGLQHIKTGNIEAEYLTLEYAGNDKIYVPVTSLHLICRYTGSDPEHAPLQKLGSKQWEKIKDKANKKIRDVAVELLDIYGRREAAIGFAFAKPDKDFIQFREAFPFEETPDQEKAINDVISDMTKARVMDRLVCGDVGFGKTEVAMQAAFLAVQGGKQVAILAPTTLLAAQHYENFKDRFADWPVRIGVLSRLQTPKEQKQTLENLTKGSIDIVIGTHKLLNPDVKFKALGLLVVDEEHRFGVRQKEKIKSLRANIDILTLTATPIPRTLNMSLTGTRDLSIIATPPERRLAIKTFVHESNPALIREAVLRESMRGGQVYFLHNEVATMNATAEKLQTIIPEARIAIAHGQMRERALERVMSEFYHQKYNILVSSTIIESGIDVPSANTIIINRADKFGLAQLHQLRGRVGRSHHQAYAYLLIPPEKVLTRDAKKRLEAITSLEDLGAGFMLATHDLEIRGAGELLGEEQSGQMQAIGFSLYIELLDKAVTALKEGRDPALEEPISSGPEIDLQESAFIPENYVMDVHMRLTLYKRLSSCETENDIQQLKAEMIDRFGLLPEVTQTLFSIAHLKLKIAPLGIKKIDVGKNNGSFQFDDKPNIDLAKMVMLIQKEPKSYQLQGTSKLKFVLDADNTDKKIATIECVLKKLTK